MKLWNSTYICGRYIQWVERCIRVLRKEGFFKWKNVFEKIKVMTKLMKDSGFDISFNPVLGKHAVFLCKKDTQFTGTMCGKIFHYKSRLDMQ
jgi:hypothetical protein